MSPAQEFERLLDALTDGSRSFSASTVTDELLAHADPDCTIAPDIGLQVRACVKVVVGRWLREIYPDPEHEGHRLEQAGVPLGVIAAIFAARADALEPKGSE